MITKADIEAWKVVAEIWADHPEVVSQYAASGFAARFLEIVKELEERNKKLREALDPFGRFFKGEDHDLSLAKDETIVAAFLDKETKVTLAELWIKDFRKAGRTLEETDA